MIAPSLPPKHETSVTAPLVVTVNNGSVITSESANVQLLLSVTVNTYVPADNPVALAPVPPEGLQL